MIANVAQILTGVCLATVIFRYVVSGCKDVTLRTWKGALVYFLLCMGAGYSVRIALTLLGSLKASP
jgi:hypothetical protein